MFELWYNINEHEFGLCRTKLQMVEKGVVYDVRGDPITLVYEYAKDFCMNRAMDAAGYRGRGRIYEAVRDIEEHAHILRRELVNGGESVNLRGRILREYERIAFADEGEGIKISDKLKALEVYRALTDTGHGDSGNVVVNYDYGDDE